MDVSSKGEGGILTWKTGGRSWEQMIPKRRRSTLERKNNKTNLEKLYQGNCDRKKEGDRKEIQGGKT